ncbi:hypothetical protein HYH03_010678 [Edaphochlamys debaryana]|uniref:FAS1 domain-containing protein n=1 Tax=Edaphochlamys debaryana TaxID=47281 RepID=A0A836BVT5_9CHLO|nr:hypothetical protein HYH03_010678 [Edaphochlamys debaryana]|eukprot:KAG2491006.1 hypothetical protein HYH03_010678 [Edaphochlamys debaryana]
MAPRVALLLAAAALLAAAGGAQAQLPAPAAGAATAAATSSAKYICTDPDLATLCKILRAGGRGQGATRLSSPTATDTIFAPVDGAFFKDSKKVADELEIKSFDAIFKDPKAADRLLQNLIIPNKAFTLAGWRSGDYKSLLGQELELSSALLTKDKYVKSEEIKATITEPDIPAGRSVIFKVNRVPVPDDFL